MAVNFRRPTVFHQRRNAPGEPILDIVAGVEHQGRSPVGLWYLKKLSPNIVRKEAANINPYTQNI